MMSYDINNLHTTSFTVSDLNGLDSIIETEVKKYEHKNRHPRKNIELFDIKISSTISSENDISHYIVCFMKYI